MKKIYLLLLTAFVFTTDGIAQPTVLGTQLVNGSYVKYDLNSIGLFKQYRLLASSSAAISTRNWEFASGTAGATNYTINWRPYTGGNTLSSNLFIPTSFANGAKYNTASGGSSGLLPVITAGNYYTFNVNINAAADNQMELLETNFNPVTITTVSNTTPANASNSVLITCTTSAAPSVGENVYVRYSTDGYATSALSQFTFTGTTGKALIPCQTGGTVVSYYVLSSNITAAQITADVATYGQSANDMATLNLNNNGGPNYTYTQGNGANFGGIYSIPSPTCYTTVGAFVTALNAGTVTAPVTCYAIGGSPMETATVGGISITQTGTVANPIIFQKFGSGSYTIQASSALTSGRLYDAIIKLIGADYITIDGFTLQENPLNTTTAAGTNNMTEWGVALLHASVTDGAQNNTIQNNIISLNISYSNTFGIYSNARHTATVVTVADNITNNTTGPNSGNKIYGNTISNVNMGIAFIGSLTPANQDVGNDIGGNSAATGNTITNWGGAAAASGYLSNSGTSYCILSNMQISDNVSYNTLTSAVVSGVSATIRAILKAYTTGGSAPTGTFTSNITHNTITLQSAFTSGTFECIKSQDVTAAGTVTVNIDNNTIINSALSGAGTSSNFVGITNTSVLSALSISNNLFRNNTSTATTGGFTGIANSGAIINTINITNNQIGDAVGSAIGFSAVTNATITGISNSGAAATATVNLNNNSVYGVNVLSSGQITAVNNTGGTTGTVVNMSTDSLRNTVVSGVGASTTIFGLLNTGAVTTLNMNTNVINGNTSTATTGGFTGIQNGGAVVTTVNMLNNLVGNGGAPVTLSNTTTGSVFGIINSGGAATATINMNSNTVSGISVVNSGQIIGIANTGASGSTVNIGSNNVLNTVISGAGASTNLIGITSSSPIGAYSVTNNIIKGNTSTATTGGFTGIQNSGAVVNTVTITGNQVGTSSSDAVTFSAATTGQILAITNTSAAATTTVNITNNAIQGLSGVSSTNNTEGILNSSSAGVAVNITGNTIGSASRNFITYTAASTGQVYGILNSGGASTTNLTVTNNTVDKINGVSFSNTLAGIANTSAATGGTINLNNNSIGTTTGTFLTTTANSTGTFYAMWNSNGATTATLNMNNNFVDGFFIFSTTPNLTTMACNGANLASANMNSNSFGSTGTLMHYSAAQPSTGTFRVMDIGVGSSNATSTVMCQNNTVKGITYAVTGAATVVGIFLNATPLGVTIQGNQFNNLILNTSDNVWMILDIATRASGQILTVNNNSIVNGLSKTAGPGYAAGHYSGGGSVDGAELIITNNNFSNISVTGSSNIYGVAAVDGVSSSSGPTEIITGNTISNLTAASGTVTGIYEDFAAAALVSSNTISAINSNYIISGIDLENNNGQGNFNLGSNTISNLASTGASGHVRGIVINSSSVPTFNIFSNLINNLSSAGSSNLVNGIMFNNGQTANIDDNLIYNLTNAGTSAPLVAGLNIISGTTLNIYLNHIYTISATGNFTPTAAIAEGIRITAGTTVTVYNNFVSDLTAPNTNYTDVIRAIDINSSIASSNYNLYYNSVYLNATSTGTDFGTSGIYHTTNATGTTASLNMIDNIIVNTSTANGAGVTAAYRRSDATLTNFAATSDYNLFYAGSPLANRLIYYDGTNADQTIAAYQSLVSTRDANSISSMPIFNSSIDLHLDVSNCQIDGMGTPIGSVLYDFDGQTRDLTTPDIGADEFTSTYTGTLAGTAGSATCANKTVSASGTTYATSSCALIAKVVPSGGAAVAGKINTCVTLDATQQFYNAEPYVQRHFDLEPTTSNPTTTSATITLYFTDLEFANFNTNNPTWPKLPTVGTGGNASIYISNLKVTQYHGTATTNPSKPGFYTANAGSGVNITPTTVNYNAVYGDWEITFPITGFSGFYVHSTIFPLPVTLNYLNGVKQGSNNLLSWSVTCNTTPRVTLTLERSPDSRNFNNIYSITADAVRCGQPFDYTDAQSLAGMNYYRLKIVDADGKITYSNIIALINGTKGFALMNIAPNPVTGNSFKLNTTSATSAKMDLVISDMLGRIVNRQTVSLTAGFNSTDINVSDLAPGTYNIYGITADEKSSLIRFVKQ